VYLQILALNLDFENVTLKTRHQEIIFLVLDAFKLKPKWVRSGSLAGFDCLEPVSSHSESQDCQSVPSVSPHGDSELPSPSTSPFHLASPVPNPPQQIQASSSMVSAVEHSLAPPSGMKSFDELKEREERKTNLIVYNIVESNNDDKAEQAKEDLEKVKQVLMYTNPDLSNSLIEHLTVDKLSRLGNREKKVKKDDSNPEKKDEPNLPNSNKIDEPKPDNDDTNAPKTNATKPRPIKLSLPDEKTKFKVLGKSKVLRNYQAQQNIGIKPDLTRQQQLEDKELREQLKKRKDEGEDVMIYKNKIILREEHTKLKQEYAANSTDQQ